MNWSKIYIEICDHLKDNGKKKYADYLNEALLMGATGGEIFDIAITRLMELQDKKELQEVKDKVNSILNYAKSINHL